MKKNAITVSQYLAIQKKKKGRTKHTNVANSYEKERIRIELQDWEFVIFEKIIIPLAYLCGYQPDLLCLKSDSLPEFVEVKGSHIEDDAMVKMRVSSRMLFPLKLKLAKKIQKVWKVSYLDQTPMWESNSNHICFENQNSWIIGEMHITNNGKNYRRKLQTQKTTILPNGTIILQIDQHELQNENAKFLKRTKSNKILTNQELLQFWENYLNCPLIKLQLNDNTYKPTNRNS